MAASSPTMIEPSGPNRAVVQPRLPLLKPELASATAPISAMREERFHALNLLSFGQRRWRPLNWPDPRCRCVHRHERQPSQRLVVGSADGMRIACGQLRCVLARASCIERGYVLIRAGRARRGVVVLACKRLDPLDFRRS